MRRTRGEGGGAGGGKDEEEDADYDMSTTKTSKALMISPMLAPRGKCADHRLERCRSCCVRLYFNTLEALLITEEQRLGTSNHQSLLGNISFHRALLACCMEVALKSCNYVTLAFPCTLNTFEVSPFDLCKMVESFIRHQPYLPMMLRNYLGSVEEQIVESMAWHGPHIRAQEGHGQDTPDGLPSKSVELLVSVRAQAENFNRITFSCCRKNITQYKKVKEHPTRKCSLQRYSRTSNQHSNTGTKDTETCNGTYGETRNDVEITCRHRKVEDTIEWAIDRARSLLYDRHLDNTVLCVLYGVAKVMRAKPEVSFKKIIAAHKKCNGAKLEIIRHVILNSPNERGDVIQFYNKVFIPKMKSYLLSLTPSSSSSSSTTKTSSTAVEKKGEKKGAKKKKKERKKRKVESKTQDNDDDEVMMTPKKQRSSSTDTKESETTDADAEPLQRMNVFVVPRRVSMTPRTRALYAFGESPRRDLMRINRAVNPTIPIPSISEIFASAAA